MGFFCMCLFVCLHVECEQKLIIIIELNSINKMVIRNGKYSTKNLLQVWTKKKNVIVIESSVIWWWWLIIIQSFNLFDENIVIVWIIVHDEFHLEFVLLLSNETICVCVRVIESWTNGKKKISSCIGIFPG